MTGEVECVLYWYFIFNFENDVVFLVYFDFVIILYINKMIKNLISNCSFILILIKICEKIILYLKRGIYFCGIIYFL